MQQEYFEKISDMFKKAQEPIRAIAELNAKTLQSFSYMTPEDFTKISRPEEFIQKQIELAITNGHKSLDYIQKLHQITEKTLLSLLNKSQGKK